MSHSHTPLPWVRWSEENSDGTKVSVCHVDDAENPVCVATVEGRTSEEAEANVRLILEAVKQYVTK